MSHSAPAPSLHIVEAGNSITARFVGLRSLTEENVDLLDREFAALADRKGSNVALDFIAIDYLTSIIVSKLLVLHRQVRAGEGQLTLMNLKPFVRQVFKVARLDQVLNIASVALSA
jgi:anti-anti-sigma factor